MSSTLPIQYALRRPERLRPPDLSAEVSRTLKLCFIEKPYSRAYDLGKWVARYLIMKRFGKYCC